MNTIKKAALIAVTAAIVTQPALADNDGVVQNTKAGLTFTGGGLIGAAAGGPIGLFVGALGGAYLAEKGKRAHSHEIQLEKKAAALSTMEQQVDQQELKIAKLEQLMEEKMQVQLYFKTGEDKVSEDDSKALLPLADFLKENDYMHVTIEGHADPRGTDEYNNVLSAERAKAAAQILIDEGVDEKRISTRGFGSSLSTARSGDLDAYAKDRKVKIEIHSSRASGNYASLN